MQSVADDSNTDADDKKKGPVKMGVKFVDSIEDCPDHIDGTGFDFKRHLRRDMVPPSAEDVAK